ncbi:MAG: nucleotidyltransferase family protein [Eubacterium sp.]
MIYKIEMNYILELLKCAVTEELPSSPPENINWDNVFLFAKKHKIVSTLYFGMQKLSPCQQQSIKNFDNYLLAYKKALVLDANRTYELEYFKDEFEKNNIDYIFLKGSVTKYLYPDTSMRVMSDIDIFYRNADFNLVNQIFTKNGYKILKKEPKEVSFFKSINSVKIEMQTQLIDEGYETWFNYLKNIWDKCLHEENSHEYKMTNENFYIYHIIHMAKHFKNGGIGLTHVIDIWIIINSYTDMNYEYITRELGILKLNIFERNLRMLVSFWFGDFKPDEDTSRTLELLGNYLFSNGAFGRKSQQEANAIVAREDTKISWRKKIFPDRNTMIDYYGSILKRHVWLLPFYWIRLNFKRIFINRKELKNNINCLNSISNENIERTRELMNRCGL